MVNRLYSYYLSPLSSAKTDYQLMVDTILQLSQAYNSEKDSLASISKRSPSPDPRRKTAEKFKNSKLEAHFTQFEFERFDRSEEKKEEEEINVFGNRDLTQSIRFPGILGSSIGGLFNLGSINISKQSDFEYF
jgi:hypothetical protein